MKRQEKGPQGRREEMKSQKKRRSERKRKNPDYREKEYAQRKKYRRDKRQPVVHKRYNF